MSGLLSNFRLPTPLYGALYKAYERHLLHEIHSEPVKSVTVCDQNLVNHISLSHIEELPEAPSSHVQPRPIVSED